MATAIWAEDSRRAGRSAHGARHLRCHQSRQRGAQSAALLDHARPRARSHADRLGVTTELSYSTVAASLGPTDLDRLTSALEVALDSKRREREAADGLTIASYFLQYALLQEVSKAALQRACGRITLAHTMPAAEISPFSVTSFYRVGTATGLYEEADVVAYAD